jgi:hypothetical protein
MDRNHSKFLEGTREPIGANSVIKPFKLLKLKFISLQSVLETSPEAAIQIRN